MGNVLTFRRAEGDVELFFDAELGPEDIDDTVQLLFNFDEEVRDRSYSSHTQGDVELQNPREEFCPGSIFMVPSVYRELSPRSYTPQVVSIGPLHHQDKNLKGFEVQKATYMHNLFHNVLRPLDSTPEQISKECVTRVSGSIDQIKACYLDMPTYTDSELVKMMVTDACFILAFRYNPRINYSSLGPINLLDTQILRDIVLIENQIPFFVLQEIFECTFLKLHPTLTLADFIIGVADSFNIFDRDLVMDSSSISSTHDHILCFIHKSYQHPDRNLSTPNEMVRSPSVIELYRSGVRFSKKLDAKWPMDVELEFSRFLCFPLSSKPTLKMPVLHLYDSTETIIRNLIIYEQSADVRTCVSSYMKVMDMLIDIPEDVAMLTKSQVLVNRLGSDEKAANLINDMLKEVTVRDFYYIDEWKKMDEYYNAYWPKRIAELRRTYFNNPWSIIAVLAGIVLFVLTVIQTIYGVKAA